MNFESLRNFDKNAKRKLKILCPFNKNYDVTSRTSTYMYTYSISKSNVVRCYWAAKHGTLMKEDERSLKIYNILLPW